MALPLLPVSYSTGPLHKGLTVSEGPHAYRAPYRDVCYLHRKALKFHKQKLSLSLVGLHGWLLLCLSSRPSELKTDRVITASIAGRMLQPTVGDTPPSPCMQPALKEEMFSRDQGKHACRVGLRRRHNQL